MDKKIKVDTRIVNTLIAFDVLLDNTPISDIEDIEIIDETNNSDTSSEEQTAASIL